MAPPALSFCWPITPPATRTRTMNVTRSSSRAAGPAPVAGLAVAGEQLPAEALPAASLPWQEAAAALPMVNPPMPAPAPSTPLSATSISRSGTAIPAPSASVPATPNTASWPTWTSASEAASPAFTKPATWARTFISMAASTPSGPAGPRRAGSTPWSTPRSRANGKRASAHALPAAVQSALPDLPPRDSWVNIRALGAKGDGATDDTAVFKNAIAGNRAIYLPSGKYVVSDTIALKPDTVLIGLHPSATQIDLLDGTPAFQGTGAPRALVETPKGGANIMIGIELYANGINPRAVAAKWMAGMDSMMNDVRFLGGHGTNKLDGTRENPYNNTHTADPDLNRRWDSQYPSLWVTAGGGG